MMELKDPIPNNAKNAESSFRDRIATVDEKGRRKWVFAKKPRGRFYRARTWVSLFFFIIFLSLPFIHIDGRPLFLFNVTKAKFILFGQVFWPQDFFIFGLTMVTFIVFIILFTAAFGRLFCGWICPQTVFMEMLFRKIEYLIEGDAASQRMWASSKWTKGKIIRKSAKHFIFFLLSFVIANYFLAYIIGIKELWNIISEPVSEHLAGFFSIFLFSGIFYAVYAFFREQACTVVCPYGRLQGVLLDKNSMIVAYDYKRGEPRGKFRKGADSSHGDCIDCLQCVHVCPTGIDIRNGTQMECVGCTACIDACDEIQLKLHKPRGLVRYASESGILEGKRLRYTTRMKMYTLLLLALAGLLAYLLATRKDIDTTIMRTPGMLYQERGTDSITNLYNIKIANKTVRDIPVSLKLEGGGNIEIIGGHPLNVASEGQGSGSFFVVLPASSIVKRKTTVKIAIYTGDQKIDDLETSFLGPISYKH